MKGLQRIVSGAQTGVERAALDSAISRLVYSWGGWVPKGRLAEDGELPEHYFDVGRFGRGLQEHGQSRSHKVRMQNIADADATLILRFQGGGRVLGPGTKLTIKSLQKLKKPYRLFDPARIYTVPKAVRWICETRVGEDEAAGPIKILNVTGPSESISPEIYEKSKQFMNDVLGYVFTYQRWGVKVWAPKRPKAKTQ